MRRSTTIMAATVGVVAVALPAWAYYVSNTASRSFTAASLSSAVSPTATAGSATAVTVSWALPSSQLTGAQYAVTRTTDNLAVCTVASTVTSCPDPNTVTGGTTYAYAIRTVLPGTTWTTPSTAFSVTTPSAGPAAPSTPDLLAASDSGASSTDDITNDTTPSFTGTAPAGATVRLYAGATQVGSQVLGASATTWTITSSTLTSAAYSFTATATVGAATSAASAALPVTIDTVVPTASDIQTVNGTTGGKIDANDQVVFTYSEAIDPTTISTGWTGSSVGVTVSFRNSNGVGGQRINGIVVTTGSVAVNLVGQVGWTQGYMAGGNTDTTTVTGTMTLSADKKTVTVQISGAPVNANSSANASTSTLNWTPGTGSRDLAGNALNNAAVNEQGTADADF